MLKTLAYLVKTGIFLTGDIDNIYDLANKGFNIFAGINPAVAGGFEHQGYFALVDKNGYLRSRTDQFNNPIVYYLGIPESEIEIQGTDMLIEDVQKLLENE
jgi:protein SCO1/2